MLLLLLLRDAAVAAAADCADDSPECVSWAQSGECTTNPGYMNMVSFGNVQNKRKHALLYRKHALLVTTRFSSSGF